MNDLELGWVAGLFEGEGCISITGERIVRLSVPSVDPDIIERLHGLVGIGAVYQQKYQVSSGETHTLHRWQAGRLLEVQKLLRLLLPHLGLRRAAKARIALAVEPNPNGRGPRTLRSHCARGHEFTPENTVSGRRCRTCRNERALRAYHAKTASLAQESA